MYLTNMAELIPERELMKRLQLKKGRLYLLRSKGLPAIKIERFVRYDWEEVLAWLRAHSTARLHEQFEKSETEAA